MKPRIKKIADLWYCFLTPSELHIGLGYTPKHAYDDWVALGMKTIHITTEAAAVLPQN